MTTDLDRLIEAVERGDSFGIIPMTQEALTPHEYSNPHGDRVSRAFDGSLDAALSLHEALLPGWKVAFLGERLEYPFGWTARLSGPEASNGSYAANEIYSRAWLLSILLAYRETTK